MTEKEERLEQELSLIKDKLEQCHHDFKNLIGKMSMGFAVHKMLYNENNEAYDYVFISINNAFEQILGVKEEDVIGKTMYEVYPMNEKKWVTMYNDVLATGKSLHTQEYNIVTDKWYDIVAYKIGDDKFACVFKDITDIKNYESMIKLNEERLESLLRISQYRTEDTQNLLDFALSESLKLTKSKYGYIYFYNGLREEFELNTWSKDVMSDCLVAEPNTIYKLSKTGIWGEAVRQRRPIVINDFKMGNCLKKGYPEGHIELKKFMTVPIFFNDDIKAVIGAANKETDYDESDITQLTLLMEAVWKVVESKKTEKELRDSEEKFSKAFLTSPYAITITKASDGAFLEVNDAFTVITGYTRQEVIENSSVNLHLWDNLEDRDEVLRELNDGKSVSGKEIVFRKKTGDKIIGLYTAQKLILKNELYILSSINDITESKRILQKQVEDEKEKQLLNKQFRQLQKMESLGKLAGGIAHDFNNVLASMIGYTELSLQRELTDDIRQNLEKILIAGKRATELTRRILGFSRMSENGVHLINLSNSVKDAIGMLRASTPTTLDIKTFIDDNLYIHSDDSYITQIVMNLGLNASYAIGNVSGIITVKLYSVYLDDKYTSRFIELKPGRYACLLFGDTGCGIPKEEIDSIFDPFFTTKPKDKGTGLGLSTVYSIVQKHKGAIRVYSEVGQGTTFNIYLPIAENGMKNNLNCEPVDLAYEYGTGNIMVIDDEKSLTDVLKSYLKMCGYTVFDFISSKEAYFVFKSRPTEFDIIITDQTMPEITGLELIKKIRNIRKDIPIILYSGFSHLVTQETLNNLYNVSFMLKPYSFIELGAIIKKMVGTKK